ncbi:MAG: exo-alpha-sialidase, partial [Solirubrobacterales bacterium]|nr:exo-alpha-sialidase [Solirubrobacterales bacterium]
MPETRPVKSTPRLRPLLIAATLGASAVIAACGQESTDPVAGSEPIEHVHGLGINPADGALFIATHDGLFRSPEGSATAERVGESSQDTMGFTIVGPDRFLGSGHPGPGEDGQPNLGLIESGDAGLSWTGVSLAG